MWGPYVPQIFKGLLAPNVGPKTKAHEPLPALFFWKLEKEIKTWNLILGPFNQPAHKIEPKFDKIRITIAVRNEWEQEDVFFCGIQHVVNFLDWKN